MAIGLGLIAAYTCWAWTCLDAYDANVRYRRLCRERVARLDRFMARDIRVHVDMSRAADALRDLATALRRLHINTQTQTPR